MSEREGYDETRRRSKHRFSTVMLFVVGLLLSVGFLVSAADGDYMRYWINGTRFAVDLDNGSVSVGQNPVQGWDFAVNGSVNFTGSDFIWNDSSVCTAANGLCGVGGGGAGMDNYSDSVNLTVNGQVLTIQISRNALPNLSDTVTLPAGNGSGSNYSLNTSDGTSSGNIDDDETLTIQGSHGLYVNLSLDTFEVSPNGTYWQQRVNESCDPGESIRVIAQDGSVTCEVDSTGTDTNNFTTSGAVHNQTGQNKTVHLAQDTGANITFPLWDLYDPDTNETTRVDAITADCGTGFVLQNITDTGLQCVPEVVDTDTNETPKVTYLVENNVTLYALVDSLNKSKPDNGSDANFNVLQAVDWSDANYEIIVNITDINGSAFAACGGTDQVINVTFTNGTLAVGCSAQGSGGGMSSFDYGNGSASVTVTNGETIRVQNGSQDLVVVLDTVTQTVNITFREPHTVDTDTNCNASGACANGGVAYMNYSNNGEFNVSGNLSVGRWRDSGTGNRGLTLSAANGDLTLTADVQGTSNWTFATGGTFMDMVANPGAGNGYVMFAFTETQGAATNLNFYEGGTGHNRFWDSGSARFGGPEGYLCDVFNGLWFPDCNTATTGADLVVQDDIWAGGDVIVGNGTHNLTSLGANFSGTVRAGVFNGSVHCDDLIGGSDGDFCTDAGGGGSPGGSSGEIQFNDGGSFGGNANFTFVKSIGRVNLSSSDYNKTLLLPTTTTAYFGPTLAFGDGDTGIQELTDDGDLRFYIGGANVMTVSGTGITAVGGGRLVASTPSLTVPTVLPTTLDTDTGLGADPSNPRNKLALIAGGETRAWFNDTQAWFNGSINATVGATFINETDCDSLDTDANGKIICGTDAGGEGSDNYTVIGNVHGNFSNEKVMHLGQNIGANITIKFWDLYAADTNETPKVNYLVANNVTLYNLINSLNLTQQDLISDNVTVRDNLIPSLNRTMIKNGTDVDFIRLNVTGLSYFKGNLSLNDTGVAANITGIGNMTFQGGARILANSTHLVLCSPGAGGPCA